MVAIAGAAATVGCTQRDPPMPDASPSVAAPEQPASSAGSSIVAGDASTAGLAAATASDAAPIDGAVDPATLPQSRDRPSASGADFDARVAALWSAIVTDDPSQGMPFFFPLPAYRQVKDVPDPGADWKRRLVAAYAHDIHALHRRLGDDPSQAKLVALEVPEARARWVEPGEEYNKIGYYRVFGSRLRWEAGGEAHSADVKSLISWRGEWYVVHLSAIQ